MSGAARIALLRSAVRAKAAHALPLSKGFVQCADRLATAAQRMRVRPLCEGRAVELPRAGAPASCSTMLHMC